MEAEIRNTQLLHDLEACVSLLLGNSYGIGAVVPREGLGAATELVAAFCAESVPPSHCETQPILHGLAHDHFVLVIVVEGHRVLAVLAFKLNLSNVRKILFSHSFKNLVGYFLSSFLGVPRFS